MVVRAAQLADGPQVVGLITGILSKEFPTDQVAYGTEDLKQLMEAYKGPSSTFFIAEEDHHIVGTCGVKADGTHTAILRRLFVDNRYRGKGIGKELLQEALQFCRQHGFREVIIRTSTSMQQAIRLCQSMGFREDGRWTLGDVTLIRYQMRLT